MKNFSGDVQKKIESMLADVKKTNLTQFKIIMNTLGEIYKENNSGENRAVQKKLYNWIYDAEK
jgi:hypothetical protein